MVIEMEFHYVAPAVLELIYRPGWPGQTHRNPAVSASPVLGLNPAIFILKRLFLIANVFSSFNIFIMAPVRSFLKSNT